MRLIVFHLLVHKIHSRLLVLAVIPLVQAKMELHMLRLHHHTSAVEHTMHYRLYDPHIHTHLPLDDHELGVGKVSCVIFYELVYVFYIPKWLVSV